MSAAQADKTAADIVFGASQFAVLQPGEDLPYVKFGTLAAGEELFAYLRSKGITQLDTARSYPPGGREGGSEEYLRLSGATGTATGKSESVGQSGGGGGGAGWATVDTKVLSGTPGDHAPAKVARSVEASLASLGTGSVRTLYLHLPDRATPLAETLRELDAQHRAGRFERLGLSNYSAAQVEEIVAICAREGYVAPSVYQGMYNPINRAAEADLFPVLRAHAIRYFAYSPSAGGIFSPDFSPDNQHVQGSRWQTNTGPGDIYRGIYFRDSIIEAAGRVSRAAAAAGLDGHAVALRWTAHHSHLDGRLGDAVILGASSLAQARANVEAVEAGPLPPDLVALVDGVWAAVAKEELPYHF